MKQYENKSPNKYTKKIVSHTEEILFLSEHFCLSSLKNPAPPLHPLNNLFVSPLFQPLGLNFFSILLPFLIFYFNYMIILSPFTAYTYIYAYICKTPVPSLAILPLTSYNKVVSHIYERTYCTVLSLRCMYLKTLLSLLSVS
jgi:hypothetical protein